MGIEPTMRVLQTLALPLGDDAEYVNSGSLHEQQLTVNPLLAGFNELDDLQ